MEQPPTAYTQDGDCFRRWWQVLGFEPTLAEPTDLQSALRTCVTWSNDPCAESFGRYLA